MTLGTWLETWYTVYVLPDGRRAQSTKAMYRRALLAIPPALWGRELGTLSGLDLQRVVGSYSGCYTSSDVSHLLTPPIPFPGPSGDPSTGGPRAAQLLVITLRQALRIAAKLGYCDASIIDPEVLVLPYHKAQEAVVLTPEQLGAYLRSAADTNVYPLCLLAACGLRRGEALGVRWEDIDMATGVLTISRQRLRINRAYQTLPLKSASSYRQIVLPPSVLEVLERWPRSLSGWVCDVTPERWHKLHRRIIQQAGLPACTIHGLRHTFATIAARDMPIKAVQQALGHSTYKLTADLYAAHLPRPCDAPLRVLADVALV